MRAQYERAYGPRYAATKDMSLKEISAHIRATIRQAAKDGVIPSDWKYSIVMPHYGCIDVRVGIPDDLNELCHKFYQQHDMGYQSRYAREHLLVGVWTPLARLAAVVDLLESIREGANYDGSDSQSDYFDVRYYGGVSVRSISNFRL